MFRKALSAAIPLVAAFSFAASGVAQEIAGSTASVDVDSLRVASAKSPKNAGLKLRLAKALLDATASETRSDPARAADKEIEALFEDVHAQLPDASLPLRALVRDAYYRRRYEDSAAKGARLLANEPDDVDTATLYFKSLLKLDRDADAAAFFLKWIRTGLAPSSGAVQGLLNILVMRAPLKKALDEGLEAATKESPRHLLLRLTYASFLAETGRAEDAWSEFHAAEKAGLCDQTLGARHPFAHNLASRTPEPEGAPADPGVDVDALMEAIKTRPDHAGLHVRLGRRLEAAALRAPADGPERKAALEGALKAYEKAAELNPEAWSAHFRCGEIHLELGRPKEATPCFERATGLFPGFVLWSLAEAEAKALSGDVAGAATAFLRYAGRFESDPLVRGLFERLDSRGAKYLDAFDAALRKACEAEKSNAYLRSNLAYVALKRNDAETARRAAIEAESLGLVGRMGVHAHAVLREAFGLSLTPETTPAPKPKGS